VTGEDGRFIIRDLEPRPYTFSLDENTLPKGYVVIGEKSKTIEFDSGPKVIKNLNFAVIKKEELEKLQAAGLTDIK
ncbi:MAG: hypothetical protein NC936_05755, partial [Candidatus Omnitrophica bacterium]|nr:hypothetical protein [Candidatus Omnitrophota bacterium]